MNLYLSEKLDRYSFTAVRLCLAHCCEFGMPLKSILKVSLHREKLRLDFVNYSIQLLNMRRVLRSLTQIWVEGIRNFAEHLRSLTLFNSPLVLQMKTI